MAGKERMPQIEQNSLWVDYVYLIRTRYLIDTWYTYYISHTDGLVVGGPRAYEDQFRGFNHRVHARRDFFFDKKMISRKRE